MEYVIRCLLCLLKWMAVVVVVLLLGVFGFFEAMNYSNLSILVSDGMDMRTSVVLGRSAAEELPKFFAQTYLEGDALLDNTTYLDYTIRGFESQVEVESLHSLPWEDTATAVLTYTVPAIDGELPISKQTPEQLADPNKIPPPPWQGGRYEMTLSKFEDQWKIVALKLLETVAPSPTPTPQRPAA